MLDKMREAATEFFVRYTLKDVIDECVLKEQTGFDLRYSALAHIKKSGFIEFSYSTAVVALYVVGVYLKHWLGEGSGFFADAEIGECLF